MALFSKIKKIGKMALRLSVGSDAGSMSGAAWMGEEVVLSNWVTRQAVINETELRAISLTQLEVFAALIEQVLRGYNLLDDSPFSSTNGQRILWPMANMYHLCDHIIKPLTAKYPCSLVELVAAGAQVWLLASRRIG